MTITINNVDARHISKDALFKVSYSNLLEIINSIIDWDKSEFPKQIDLTSNVDGEPQYVEDRNALGDNPKLRENVLFYFHDQQLLVVDDTTLGLVNSDTGVFGLIRVINDFILPEYKIRKSINYLEPLKVDFPVRGEILSEPWLPIPIYSQFLNRCEFKEETIEEKQKYGEPKIRLPYFLLDFFKTEFPDLKEKKMIATVNSPDIDLFDVTIEILPNGRIYYDEDDFADKVHVMAELLSILAEKMN